MPKKSFLSLKNWERYQARSDKDLPWIKLWGSLFDREWWQEMDDKFKVLPVIFLDVARKFNNKMPQKRSFYTRNYNLLYTDNEWFIICKLLQSNGFLSDVAVGHIREDKRREDRSESDNTSKSKQKEDSLLKTFGFFYSACGRKMGRKEALKAWLKIAPDEELFKKIMKSLEEHKKSDQWKKDNGKYIPYPATWLNQERWNDELRSGPTPRTRIVV